MKRSTCPIDEIAFKSEFSTAVEPTIPREWNYRCGQALHYPGRAPNRSRRELEKQGQSGQSPFLRNIGTVTYSLDTKTVIIPDFPGTPKR